jgi:ribonuclease HI
MIASMTENLLETKEVPRNAAATPLAMSAISHKPFVPSPVTKVQQPTSIMVTLTHTPSGNKCLWILSYAMSHYVYRHPEEGNIDTTGMNPAQVRNAVVFAALEALIASGIGAVTLHTPDDAVRSVLKEVNAMLPGLTVLDSEPEWALPCLQATEHIVELWFEKNERHRIKQAREEWLAQANPVVVHVDASARLHRSTIGVGFVVSDETLDSNTGKIVPSYTFHATTTTSPPTGKSTLAELTAIRQALKHGFVMTQEVKSNKRGLKIVTDSLESVTLLTALRTGTKCRRPITQAQWDYGQKIVDSLAGIKDVTFEWVRGHAGDPINEATDRLAVAARRNSEMEISKEVASGMLIRIEEDTRAALAALEKVSV